MSRTKSIWEDIAINKHQTKPRTDIKNKQIAAKAQNLAKLSTSVILKLNNLEIEALLDTGSSTTMVSTNLASQCALNKRKLTDGRSWKDAGGHKLEVVGVATVCLAIGNLEFMEDVVIVDGLVQPLLIGTDIIARRKFVIDYKKRMLIIQGQETPIDAQGWDILTPIAVTIPARSESRIWLQVPDSLGEVVLVENTKWRHVNVTVAEGLHQVQENHTLCVRVINREYSPVVVRKSAALCNVTNVVVKGHVQSGFESKEELVANITVNTSSSSEILNEVESIFKPSLTANIDETNMSKLMLEKYRKLLDDNQDVFSKDDNDIGLSSYVHDIKLSDDKPFKSRAYRIPISQQTIADEHVENMLRMGIIKPSASEYSSPIVLVKKHDGSIRFCIDYRKLNSVTIKDNYPMPLIEERLNSIFGSTIFSDLDLTSGYWQFLMAESATKLTAFICQKGLFEFVRMPFGLCNAGATFQRAINKMLSGLSFALAYIDDVLVHSSRHEDHLEHLSKVFERLRQAKLKIKLRKCHFGCRETKFLGYVISASGIRMNNEKIEAIINYPTPMSAKQTRKWNGLTSQYRQFIPNYPNVNAPLQTAALLTHKDPKTKKRVKSIFEWTTECQKAFDDLKVILTKEPITLLHPDCSKKFRLITDASKVGLGAVLAQLDSNGTERVICFAGRVLLDAEKNYSTSERELLAIKWAVRKFRCYLYGVQFEVYTDHKPLVHMKSSQNPSDRMLKWILELEEYNATYFYRPGNLNIQADVLSRAEERVEDESPLTWYPRNKSLFQLESEQDKILKEKPKLSTNSDSEEEVQKVLAINESNNNHKLVPDDINKQMLTDAQWQDPTIQKMLKQISEGANSNKLESYKQDNHGTLYLLDKINGVWRLVIPRSYVKLILSGCHDDIGGSHLGRQKTLDKVASRFYWVGMARDVQNWVASCAKCCSRKSSNKPIEPCQTPLPTVENPFDRIAVDFVGPLPVTSSGNKYILVFVDYTTRWPEAFATKDMKASTVAEIFIREILCRHGAPVQLLSDQGQDFLAHVVKEICTFTRTHKVQTSAYHPQTNGLCERFNGTICEALSAYCNENQSNWDVMLPIALFGCRISTQMSTKRSPESLLYARELRLPMNVDLYLPKLPFPMKIKEEWKRAQLCIEKIAAYNKTRHDEKNKPLTYVVGDYVRVKLHTARAGRSLKLGRRWSEPVKVVSVFRNNVEVIYGGKSKKINQIHVKPVEVKRTDFLN